MKRNILIVGVGYFGNRIAEKLSEYHQDVMVVDINEERVNECLPYVTNGRIGDVTSPSFVKSLGVRDYDICIVAIGDEFLDSLQATSLLKDMGAQYVVARASSDVQEKFLLRNGADRVIFPEKTLAEWTAMRCASNHVFDYMPLDDDYAIMEIELPHNWVGHSIGQLNIRAEFSLNVIALKQHGVMTANVDPSLPLQTDDRLVVLGRSEDIKRCFRL